MNKTTSAATKSVVVKLDIKADEFLRLYKGTARDVFATATNGQKVRFPANILRPFVTRDGVRGRFKITFSANGKLIAIDKFS